MRISTIHLTNFKRFSDLLITDIPSTSKLVLLIGSNGSGKSSLFDAFSFFDGAIKQDVGHHQDYWDYFLKKKHQPVSVKLTLDNNAAFTVNNVNFQKPNLASTSFYGRTSFRQIPRLTRTALGEGGSFDIQKDSDRPRFFIERDNRFENDIEKITENILRDFFRTNETNAQIRQKFIDPINVALTHIFGNGNGTKLQLIEIIPPLEGKIAQISFRKGDSEIHYNYLSAGEKEVFNLLINLLSRGSLYQDTIYFLDEIDLHLNTKVQFNLIKEITENWIPENCQLWTASHALGFIEYAKQAENATLIDFDDLDFDLPIVLTPEPKNSSDIYEIAVGKEFLPSLFKHQKIYFVENKDKDFYASLGISNAVFISDNNRNNVYHKVRATEFKGIVDRDFLTDQDIILIRQNYPNLYVLNYYSIENYLYHPDNLLAYHHAIGSRFDRDEYVAQLTVEKNKVIHGIIPTLSLKRTEYPYFGEPEFNGKGLQNHFKNKGENGIEASIIADYLKSNELETFFKALPMKSYCTQLPQRQTIAKIDLAKTIWFRNKIEELLHA